MLSHLSRLLGWPLDMSWSVINALANLICAYFAYWYAEGTWKVGFLWQILWYVFIYDFVSGIRMQYRESQLSNAMWYAIVCTGMLIWIVCVALTLSKQDLWFMRYLWTPWESDWRSKRRLCLLGMLQHLMSNENSNEGQSCTLFYEYFSIHKNKKSSNNLKNMS